MKYLLTIIALALTAIGANAQKLIAEADFTTAIEFTGWFQFADEQNDGKVELGAQGLEITFGTKTGQLWQPQIMVISDGSFNLEEDGNYKVVVTAKFPTAGRLQINMGSWSANDQATFNIAASDDFQTVECDFKGWSLTAEGAHLLFQCGDFMGTTILKSIKVYDLDGKSDGDQGTGEDKVDKNCVVNGIIYGVKEDGSAEVTGVEQSSSIVDILSSVYIDGKTYQVTSIGNFAFYQCRNIISLNIPTTVKFIGSSAFEDCTGLTTLSLKDGLEIIGGSAFQGCTGLQMLTIPSTVKSISINAFADCKGITDVYCYSETIPETHFDAFDATPTEKSTLHVPANAVETYRLTWPWSDFLNILSLEGGDIPETPETLKCANPVVSYYNGKISFSCATDGVSYKYTITNDDVKSGSGNEVSLGVTYNLSVLATKTGYENSDRVTATLCWVDTEPKMEGVTNDLSNVLDKAVLIQNNGNQIIVSGVDAGTTINVFDLTGKSVGSARVSSETTFINTTLRSGDIGIVKIGNKAVKVLMK